MDFTMDARPDLFIPIRICPTKHWSLQTQLNNATVELQNREFRILPSGVLAESPAAPLESVALAQIKIFNCYCPEPKRKPLIALRVDGKVIAGFIRLMSLKMCRGR